MQSLADLLDRREVCRFFGGTRPINAATLAQLPYASPLAVITAIVGSGLLLKMQSHLARSRFRLDKVHKTYFDEDQLKAIGLTDKEIKVIRDEKRRYLAQFLHGWEFLFILLGILWVGAFIVVSGAQSVAL
jgi:hypothetical protein